MSSASTSEGSARWSARQLVARLFDDDPTVVSPSAELHDMATGEVVRGDDAVRSELYRWLQGVILGGRARRWCTTTSERRAVVEVVIQPRRGALDATSTESVEGVPIVLIFESDGEYICTVRAYYDTATVTRHRGAMRVAGPSGSFGG